jgi:hypothetical protein
MDREKRGRTKRVTASKARGRVALVLTTCTATGKVVVVGLIEWVYGSFRAEC